LNLATLNNDTIESLIQAHIYPGVYYSTNITSDDGNNITATSVSGTNITLQASSPNNETDGSSSGFTGKLYRKKN
jgi:hypothetical protein